MIRVTGAAAFMAATFLLDGTAGRDGLGLPASEQGMARCIEDVFAS